MPLQETDKKRIKSIIESIFIVAAEPLSYAELKETIEGEWDVNAQEMESLIHELQNEYLQDLRGFQISEIAGKYQLCTASQNADWVKSYLRVKNAEGLSKPALETLAVIAYRQPITKVEIEGIRGVNVDGVLKKLTEKGLIKTRGKKEVLGHPFLYVTTEKFLEYFGLKNLEELPQKDELKLGESKNERENSESTEIATENRSN